ncbi:putative G-protein coupled receptor 82 [Turdus rufiventris]|nr:putative G-protein coupled receptor 82 [Turdus rufiventris]
MNNSSCLQPSPATTVALPIIYSCLLPAGIFGNILAACVFSQKAPPRRTQYIYLANLVTANLLVCSTMPFLAAYFAEGHRWPYGSVACRIAHHLGALVMQVSMYVTITILCSIALSQYATLTKNCTQHCPALPGNFHGRLLQEFRRPKFAKYLCLVIWLIVLCITFIAITYNVHERVSGEFPTCYNIKPKMMSFKVLNCIKVFLVSNSGKAFVQYRQFEKLQIESCIGLVFDRRVHGGEIPQNLKA